MGKFEEPVPNKIEKIKSDGSEGKQSKLNGFGIAAKQLMDGNKNASSGDGSAVAKSADKTANSGVEILHKDGKGDDIKVIAGPEILHKDVKGNESSNVSPDKNGIDAITAHPNGPEAGLKQQSEDFMKKFNQALELPAEKVPQALEVLYKDNQAQVKQVELKIASITKSLAEATFMPF